MSGRPLGRARQSGAALLVLLTLVVLVGASAMLSRVNQTAQLKAEDQANTMEALSSAKAALIAYAVSDEDRPGELPCPDVDNNRKLELGTDFDASGGCTTMRGWFPWQTLKASDLRDGAEERLWYALSTDFRAGNTAVALNSETAGQLTVDATTDIVAVIIAPGSAFDTQNGRNNASPDANTHANEWLEATNQDADLTTYATEHSGSLNDQILILTRSELMSVVEKRVLGEVSVALTDYSNTYNAYPWLSPFADPRSSTLTGTASSGSTGVTLSDTSTNFISLGVRPGDALQNTTDGSSGIIATVTSTSVTVDRLLGGASNTFSPGDAYHFSRYNGVIGASEGHLPFHEIDESFSTNFIADWNLQDANGNDVSTSGGGIGQYLSSLQQFVESTAVSGALPVALNDGACTWTADTDLGVRCTGRFTLTYFEGTATTDDDDRLKDKSLHFDDWGAVTGAWVENLDDGGSWGIVKKVNNNKLKLEDDLQDGINNEFVAGDRYRVHIPSQTTSTTTPLTADGTSSNETLVDDDQDFIVLGVEVGDTIYNVDDNEWGRITGVGTDTLQAQDMDFDGGEEYYIRYDFVGKRSVNLTL